MATKTKHFLKKKYNTKKKENIIQENKNKK